MRLPLVALLATVALEPVLAQTQQPPVFRGGTDILAVDVSVVDRRGEPITDLGRAEFAVTIDGRARPVLSAEYISFEPTLPRSPTPAPLRPGAYFSSNTAAETGRLIAIVVDQGNIGLGLGRSIARDVGRLLDRLTASDRVALMTIPGLGPSVEFTTDHDLLRQALGRVAGHATPVRRNFNISDTEALEFEHGPMTPVREEVLERECSDYRDQRAREQCARDVITEARDIAHELRWASDGAVSALAAFVSALGAIEGPKTVIFVSEGLVTRDRESQIADLGELASRAHVTINVIALDGPDVDMARQLRPRTPLSDRDMMLDGLDLVAGMARGAVFTDIGSGGLAFDRIAREMSGYYLLGIEPLEGDQDGERHRVEVEVGRRDAIVRARREFRFPDRDGERDAPTGEELVAQALGAPVSSIDLPMRVATYAFLDTDASRVRVVVAADVTVPPGESPDLSIAYRLIGPDGSARSSPVERQTAQGGDGETPATLSYVRALLVEPGVYTLKLATADAAGRTGSVEHRVQAWKMADEAFAVGDLLLMDAPPASTEIRPAVVARLDSGQLGVYTELYASDPTTLRAVEVTIEICEEEDGPALLSGSAEVRWAGQDLRAPVQGVYSLASLPPGPYLARAIVTDGGRPVGKLVRPFILPPGVPATASRTAPAPRSAPAAPAIARFERDDALTPAVLGFFVDELARAGTTAGPAMVAVFAQARQRQLEGTSRQAFESGDQLATAFLRGLELFGQGKLNEAATQFAAAEAIDAAFFPATFYLGACYAADGRDQQAADLWRRVTIGPAAPPALHGLTADLWLRLGDGAQAVAGLRDAVTGWPEDDGLVRRLGFAYALAGQLAEAVSTLAPYLERHMSDHEALFAAVRAMYEARAASGSSASGDADGERAARYARAYAAADGPELALVTKWAESIASGAGR